MIDYILTGPTALYEKGYIDYNPDLLYISVHHGKYTLETITNGLKETKIKLDAETKSFGIYAEKWNDGKKIYSDERLLIELNKFKLSQEIKSKALNSLLKKINVDKLVQVYFQLSKIRRSLNIEWAVLDIVKKYKNPIETIMSSSNKVQGLSSYLLKVMERENLAILLKGGTAIEIYWKNHKRKTLDIDTHASSKDIQKIINVLSSKKNVIRFKLHELNSNQKVGQELTASSISKYRILKIACVPVTYGKKYFDEDEDFVKLTINTSFPDINNIIKEYNISKGIYGIFQAKILTFTIELLIAEKFQSIISKPEITLRTKDLIDLFFLLENEYDIRKINKWLLIKWSSQRNPCKNNDEIKNIININKNKELIKIKEDWDNSVGMYNVENIIFEEAKEKYDKLIKDVLENI